MVAKKILERKEGDIAQGMVPGIQFDEGRTVYLDDELRLLFREQWEKRKSKEYDQVGDTRKSGNDDIRT